MIIAFYSKEELFYNSTYLESRPNVVTRAMSQSLAMFTKIFVCIDGPRYAIRGIYSSFKKFSIQAAVALAASSTTVMVSSLSFRHYEYISHGGGHLDVMDRGDQSSSNFTLTLSESHSFGFLLQYQLSRPKIGIFEHNLSPLFGGYDK